MRILIVFAAAASLIGGLAVASWLLGSGAHLGWVALAGVAGVGAFAWLYRFDDRLKQTTDSDRIARADQRFNQLKAAARAHDFELKVKGASNILLTLFALALSSMAFFPDADWIYRVVAWGIVLPLGILTLLYLIPQIGKPVIVLTRSGFRTATSPDIPWRLVDGIHYSETLLSANDSGAAPVGSLNLNIPTLPQEIKRFSPMFRLLHGLPGKRSLTRIIVMLRKTNEPPSAVGRLAEYLWSQSTGRTNDWNPHMSEAYNAANRELAEMIAAYKKRPASSDYDLEDLTTQIQRAERNSRIISSEINQRSRELNLAVWVPVGFLVVLAIVMLVLNLR